MKIDVHMNQIQKNIDLKIVLRIRKVVVKYFYEHKHIQV